MNNAEAIHKMEFMRDAYQKLIDENVDEGRFVGTDVTGTWKADTPLNEVYAEHVEALDLAISALEKQEPMKPMAPELDPLGGVTHPCGNCGGELVSKFHDFCPWCGQAIKWEK